MNTVNLEDLLRNVSSNMPYQKSLKVRVVATDAVRNYTTGQGDQRQYLNVAVADSTRCVKATVFDNTKFARFTEGSSLVLRNIIKKPDNIVVTSMTKVFPTQNVLVPENIRVQAENIIRPPAAPFQSLEVALSSPPKTRVSVRGKIEQEEATQEVLVRNDRVPVKAIYLKDISTPKAKISLWRDHAASNIRPGDFVTITDVIVNIFRNETSLSTTNHTAIQKIDAPEETKDIICVGACLDNMTVTLLINDDSVFLRLATNLFLRTKFFSFFYTVQTCSCYTC